MAPARVQVDITGAEAIAALAPDLQALAETSVREALNKFQTDNFEGG